MAIGKAKIMGSGQGQSGQQFGSLRSPAQKLGNLLAILREMQSAVIAYSGGVDSTFLLRVAREVLGDNVLAVTARSPSYPAKEYEQAQALAGQMGVRLLTIFTGELERKEYAANPPDRCYHCKRELFSRLKQIAASHKMNWIADGANYDDLGDHRPGMLAARELGVRSPLLEAGLIKQEIRTLSRDRGLPTWDQPAQACLASRIPYGRPITASALARVAQAEEYLHSLGFKNVRVRDHDSIARVEVAPQQVSSLADATRRSSVVKQLKELGYTYVTVDLEGYRSGSLHDTIAGSGT